MDIEKLQHSLQIRRDHWETQWKKNKDILEAHRKLCLFDSDLHQINETLDDLSNQLTSVKAQYGESLAAAKSTSSAFVSFEKTVEVPIIAQVNCHVNTIYQIAVAGEENQLVCESWGAASG